MPIWCFKVEKHGTVGYYDAIRNAGKLHIGRRNMIEDKYIGGQIAWQEFGWKKWFYLLPRRF